MSELDLTKKGEAYVTAVAVEPLMTIDCRSRRSIADSIEKLINMLDALDPDPDLEDTADDEPWLGWTDRGPQATGNTFLDRRGSAYDDREEENEHGGDINDERQDGDEREADPADIDQPGFIWGGQGA